MKRLYITKKNVWAAQAVNLNGVKMAHTAPTKLIKEGALQKDIPLNNYELFDVKWGTHYIDLDSEYILLAGDVEHSALYEEIWHSHPEVARLPHPIYEGNVPVKDLLTPQHSIKQYTQLHHNALLNHKELGATPDDTVLTLSNKAKKLHPLVKLSAFT